MDNIYALLAKAMSKRIFIHLCCLMICGNIFTAPAGAQTAVNFTSSSLSGETLVNPTSLQFGPDNRLYVSQQNGSILIYTIKKNSANNYSVLATETILSIKNIPNHNDDGTSNPAITDRQITGILVAGTSANPVLYVSSSDPRIGGGGTAGDKNLDTNSGIISTLTWNGASWVKVDLVKGLPRSEENHANNGMALDAANNILYVAHGGHTNAGAPSNNFAFLTEYALSAAILKIDLDQIQTQFGGSYTLPTLDDPTRANSGPDGSDANDPWGGNDGINQAKLVAGGPVQIHSAGYRNAYDLVITKTTGKAGRMYTIDNGANGGWGGYPDLEGTPNVTNKYVVGEPGSTTAGVNDAKVNNLDNLHLVSAPGMAPIYAGHPNPIRANPAGAGIYTFNNTTGVGTFSLNPTADWPPVPVSMANPVESDYRNPGVNDGALYTWVSSTNGIAEYTSLAFNGALAGDLLAASFDGNIYRIQLNTSGTAVSNVSVLAGGFGSQPLDVTAQDDEGIFPGTIWAATYGAGSITIFEPAVTGVCTGDVGSFTLDDDADGYSNGDETANGTDPCSAASKPEDFDGDLVSNLRDSDDDNDGLNDMTDKFAWDNLNGKSTYLSIDYPFLNGNPGFGLFGMGFTGLMTNNTTDYQANFDASKPNLIMGGAVGIATVPAEAGDATTNNQKYAFQFGLNISQASPPFIIQSKLLGSSFFDGATGNQLGTQSQGIYFGTGDQDNYMKLVLHANNANPGFQILIENGGVVTYSDIFPVSNILSASAIDVFFDVNPANGVVQCKYQTNSAASPVLIGPAITLTGNMLTALQNNNAVAIGLIASAGNKPEFTASWDYLKATSSAPQALTEVIRINSGGPNLVFGNESWKADQYFSGGSTYTSTMAISNTSNDALYQTERYGNITYNIPVPQTGQYTVELHFAEVYFSTSGSRVFNLNVESGQFALQNIDLYKDYGGKDAASVIKAANVQVNDGFLTIALTSVVNNAKISGLAVFLQSAAAVNQAPVANAGADKTITLPASSVVLSGSGSDPEDGANVTYAWSQVSGPSTAAFSSTSQASPTVSNLIAGTYTFALTVKDSKLLSSPPDEVSVTVNPEASVSQQVLSFTLINASNEQDIQTLSSNTTLDLANLPSQSLNIRANTSPAAVGSVVFELSGTQIQNYTDNGTPYALFGDVAGNYNAWTPAVGSYTLKATPYSGASGGGTAGTPLTINFTVVNETQANQPPVITKPPNVNVIKGQTFTYQVIANDPEGTALSYSATNLPASLNINASSGLISGTVSVSKGTFPVTLTVKDLAGLTASTSFVMKLNPNKTQITQLPEKISSLAGQSQLGEEKGGHTSIMNGKSMPVLEINTIENISQFQTIAFPNPAHRDFSITFGSKDRSEWKFTLYSTNGQAMLLRQGWFDQGISTVSFDLTSFNLVPGVYYLTLNNNLQERKSMKILIN